MQAARILLTLVLVLGLATLGATGDAKRDKAAGCWSGVWRGHGYVYDGVLRLDAAGRLDGAFTWTLRSSPLPEQGPLVGKTGVEYVRGVSDGAAVTFAGYKLDDPMGILGAANYRLSLKDGGSRLVGSTATAPTFDWYGEMTFVRCPPAATLPVAQPSAQPTKRALVIGINAYPGLGSAAQLERAVADAEAVGDRLASLGFLVTRLTSSRQSTLAAVLRGFEDFKKTIAPNDMVVLFYAGHGMGLADGTYLLPADVNETSLEVESTARRAAINENELTDGLRQARAGIVVAVIDACRNDLFSRAVRRSVGNERGLRPAETAGIFKIYSASEGQTALDRLPGSGDGSKNSVFTRVFLKAIGTPGLDLNRLGATVRDEVHEIARTADHQQTPAVYDKLIGSTRVYFMPETAAADRGR